MSALTGPILNTVLTRDCEAYFAPNDDRENDRLDKHHHLATLILRGRLTTAPIGKSLQRILDVGCGTGIWTIDIGRWSLRFKSPMLTTFPGDEFPAAQVVGVDLSPTQPTMLVSYLKTSEPKQK